MSRRDQIKKYEYNRSELDCFSCDECIDIDQTEKTGEALTSEEVLEIALDSNSDDLLNHTDTNNRIFNFFFNYLSKSNF